MAFRVEPVEWRREFNRERVRMLLDDLKPTKSDAASLCARMEEQLCDGPGDLDETGWAYTKAERIARAISCLVYGDVIRRMDS